MSICSKLDYKLMEICWSG